MRCRSIARILAIGLAMGCSTAPDAATTPEQTAVVSKEQATAVIARARRHDAGRSPSEQMDLARKHTHRSQNEKASSKTSMTYREGLKRIARDLGEGQ